jgi:hypothetical protein
MPHSYRSPKLELRNSGIHGIGVFAVSDIDPHEIVWVRTGHVTSLEEANALDRLLGDFSLQIEEGLFLSPKNSEELSQTGIFFNHSCSPNVFIRGQITFVTTSAVVKGTELTVDYATIEARENFFIQCACRTPHCRREISGGDWKRADIQMKYDGKFAQFLQRQIYEESQKRRRPEAVQDLTNTFGCGWEPEEGVQRFQGNQVS